RDQPLLSAPRHQPHRRFRSVAARLFPRLAAFGSTPPQGQSAAVPARPFRQQGHGRSQRMVEAYSVVIPVYNGADTIADAVASILAQSVPPASIIVVDDGSTDDTASIVSSLSGPIAFLRQDNAGPGPATTLGMQQVKTPLLATLDADDLWVQGKIERQLAALREAPDCAAVFGQLA